MRSCSAPPMIPHSPNPQVSSLMPHHPPNPPKIPRKTVIFTSPCRARIPVRHLSQENRDTCPDSRKSGKIPRQNCKKNRSDHQPFNLTVLKIKIYNGQRILQTDSEEDPEDRVRKKSRGPLLPVHVPLDAVCQRNLCKPAVANVAADPLRCNVTVPPAYARTAHCCIIAGDHRHRDIIGPPGCGHPCPLFSHTTALTAGSDIIHRCSNLITTPAVSVASRMRRHA